MVSTIGILGGSGALATARLHARIVEAAAAAGASCDDDYPRLLIHSLPLPHLDHRGYDPAHSGDVRAALMTELRKLEDAGADVLAIACNTVYAHYRPLSERLRTPLVNLPAVVARVAADRGGGPVGVLGSATTRSLGVYTRALSEAGVTCLDLDEDDQGRLDEIISAAIGGTVRDRHIGTMRRMVNRLVDAGARNVILGCTELSARLLIEPPCPLLDSVDVLASHLLTLA